MKAGILAVDDEPLQLQGLVRILQSADYQVHGASTGKEALDKLKVERVDLVLLDVMLPDINGVELAQKIKEEYPEIYVILISGTEISSESQARGLEEGADGYITRPISKRELLARIESILRIKESESKYRTVFENTGTATIIVEEDTTISLANSEFEKLSGYSKSEIIGRMKWPEFVAPQDQERMLEYHKKRRIEADSVPRRYQFLFKDREGEVKNIQVTVGMIPGTQKSVLSLQDITKRKKVEKALARELEINKDLANLSRKLLESVPIENISDMILEYAQNLTHSPYGFVGFIEPETGYMISPTMTRNVWTECHVEDKNIVFQKFGGMWGWVLNNKQALLTNNPQEDKRSTGTPEGHIPIETYLAVPAMVEDQLVGLISLANADKYTSEDLKIVERLADIYALAIRRKHSEEAIRKSEEKYRRIVEKFLKISNEILREINK